MRYGKNPRPISKVIGWIIIIIGLLIVFSLILPSGFWWFLFGVLLIAAGIAICRH